MGGVYRSPSSNDVNNQHLNILINEALDLKLNYTVIVGDFNYPSINWNDWCTSENENHPSFTFIECLRDTFLSQFILEQTRYREG